MTNAEKARAIIGEDCKKENCLQCGGRYSAEKGGCIIYQKIMQMADWKDHQFKGEKQALIEKACEWLKENARNYYSAYATEDRLIEDFKKAMKGE